MKSLPSKSTMLIAGNFGAVIGVVLGLQIERQGDVALYARSFAEVVHLDEVIEIASLFAGAFEVELADDVNFHSFFSFTVLVL